MKKSLLILTVFTAAVAAQASTCETRVDSHPNATTPQRVDYCLTPETAAAEQDGPSVIYSSVTTREPDASAPEKTSSRKQKYYNEDNMFVRHKYVGSAQFPQLKNDIQSEREIQAQQAAQAVAAKKAATEEQPARVMQPQPSENTSAKTVKNEQKPSRTMGGSVKEETTASPDVAPQTTSAPQETVTETETSSAAAATEEIPTAVSSGENWFEEADELYKGK